MTSTSKAPMTSPAKVPMTPTPKASTAKIPMPSTATAPMTSTARIQMTSTAKASTTKASITSTSRRAVAIGVDGEKLYSLACIRCHDNGQSIEGLYHCKLCGLMCEECASQHRKAPSTRKHFATKITKLSKHQTKATFRYIAECEKHPNHKIKQFCVDCGELACTECIKEDHQDCNRETIEDMANDQIREKAMTRARMELTDMKLKNKKGSKNRKKEMIKLAKRSEEFDKQLRREREKINVLLDDIFKGISQEKDFHLTMESEFLEEAIMKSREISAVVTEAMGNLDTAFMNGKNNELWIAVKKLDKIVVQYENVVSEIAEDKTELTFQFIPSEQLKAVLKGPEGVGRLKINSSRHNAHPNRIIPVSKVEKMVDKGTEKSGALRTKSVSTPNELQKEHTMAKSTIQKSLKPWVISTRINTPGIVPVCPSPNNRHTPANPASRTVTPERQKKSSRDITKTTKYGASTTNATYYGFHVQFDQDDSNAMNDSQLPIPKLQTVGKKEIRTPVDEYDCCVTGSTFLPNGRLVLMDNHNKNLKLLSPEYEIVSMMTLTERPWDVTSYAKTKVAVTYPYDQSVQLIATGAKIKVESQFRTDRKCSGIAFHKTEQWLYIGCGEGTDAQIQAFSLDGSLRKVIIPHEDVFYSPSYVAMSADCSHMHVSDLQNGVITFHTRTGAVVCRFRDAQIKRYWDVAVDNNGRVFTITTNPDSLLSLDAEANSSRQAADMTSEQGLRPCSLAYNDAARLLVVTRWKAEEIEVYSVDYITED